MTHAHSLAILTLTLSACAATRSPVAPHQQTPHDLSPELTHPLAEDWRGPSIAGAFPMTPPWPGPPPCPRPVPPVRDPVASSTLADEELQPLPGLAPSVPAVTSPPHQPSELARTIRGADESLEAMQSFASLTADFFKLMAATRQAGELLAVLRAGDPAPGPAKDKD